MLEKGNKKRRRLNDIKIFMKKPEKREFNQVFNLLKQLWPDKPLKRKVLHEEMLVKERDRRFFLAKKKKKVVGMISFKPALFGSIVHIKELVVSKNCRGKRIGQRLLDKTVNEGRKKSFRLAFLTCGIKRQKSHRFYKRYGFTRIVFFTGFFFLRLKHH